MAIDIAAAVIQRDDGKVLLLRRSPNHSTNAGQWCFVTGYVETDEEPAIAAAREIEEELGVDPPPPARAGEIVIVETERGRLHVHPYLFRMPDFDVTLDWEHTDYVWVEPPEVLEYDIVPQLDDDLRALGLL